MFTFGDRVRLVVDVEDGGFYFDKGETGTVIDVSAGEYLVIMDLDNTDFWFVENELALVEEA